MWLMFRKHAFGIIRDKVPLEKLSHAQHISLLSDGLNDRHAPLCTLYISLCALV